MTLALARSCYNTVIIAIAYERLVIEKSNILNVPILSPVLKRIDVNSKHISLLLSVITEKRGVLTKAARGVCS